ncbi:MAG: rRNA pseudouridine synthase [Parachlamydiaceae bacterium]|nr:rRNA pseudouridine synthase [Parachlamydiaceae bacterium]
MVKNRLSKVLAAAGVASRRASEDLITQGLVTVNDEIVRIPQTIVDSASDIISVRGVSINIEEKVYYMLNKPAGYICSAKKSSNTKLVIDLFEEEGHRVFTVGRLDKDTEGLILVTNDGHFANSVIHPSANLQKEYVAKTGQEIMPEHLIAISQGTLVEGVFVKPVRVTKVRRGTVKVVIMEGKKREVRLLLEAAGLEINSLTRTRLGGLQLGDLPVGHWRSLSEREKRLILE